jgi:hypothetical protein
MVKTLTASVISFGLLLALPLMVFAQAAQGFTATGGAFGTLLRNIISFANTVLIPFILGIGFLFFVWGMFLYFIKGGSDEDAQEKGKSLITYALIGFVLIFIFWGLVELLANSTGFRQDTLTIPTPKAPGATGATR